MLGIAIGGFGVLVALGVLIGHALDRKARDDAWRRIATARRINDEYARRIDELRGSWDDMPPDIHLVRTADPPPDVPGSAA